MPTDCELLRRYAEQGDEAAFTEVVCRQTDMVYSVAWRVTGNAAMAQDVTQHVFTKLAQDAARAGRFQTILGWLHTQARHRAIDAIRGEARRRNREQEAIIMDQIIAEPDPHWENLRSLVDEAVGQLREQDREAVLLRFFKGLSHEEVGRALGLTENAAQKRVDRALEKLRVSFARRGVATSAAALTVAMGANAIEAAPAGLAESAAGTALAQAGTAVGAGAGLTLLRTLFIMSNKTKIILGLLAVMAATSAIVITVRRTPEAPAPIAPTEVDPPSKSVALPEKVAAPASTAMHGSLPVTGSTPPVAPDLANINPYEAGAKADLNTSMASAIYFLERKDTLSFVKTMMPPAALGQDQPGASYEAFVKHIETEPQTVGRLNDLLDALHAVTEQKLSPGLNDSGTRAIFTLNPPVSGHKVIIFNKIDGLWYLDGV